MNGKKGSISHLLYEANRFINSISNKIGPIKSLNKIIPSMENLDMNEEEYTDFIKSRFLILDCEVLSYLQNFEDVHVPILPIKVQDDLWLSSLNMPRIKPSSSYNKIKRKHLQRRQSSLKDLQASTPYFTFEESLKNHCLFYLKQLLSQSLGLAQDNSELLRSISEEARSQSKNDPRSNITPEEIFSQKKQTPTPITLQYLPHSQKHNAPTPNNHPNPQIPLYSQSPVKIPHQDFLSLTNCPNFT